MPLTETDVKTSTSDVKKSVPSTLQKLSMAATGAVCIGLGTVTTAQANTVIDTTPSWDGTSDISSFGESNTATYGQTFTVGTDNLLKDFTFWLNDNSFSQDTIDFAAYVMEWDGNKAIGSILYQSGPQSTTNSANFEQFTFNTGGITLTSGKKYVAFLSASNFFDGSDGIGGMGLTNSDPYSEGDFVFFNNGSDFGSLTTNNWDCPDGCGLGDAAFRASFERVPEPVSILSLIAFGSFVVSQAKGKKI